VEAPRASADPSPGLFTSACLIKSGGEAGADSAGRKTGMASSFSQVYGPLAESDCPFS
jgi:hypothetical protein